jgi:hypothetical protein
MRQLKWTCWCGTENVAEVTPEDEAVGYVNDYCSAHDQLIELPLEEGWAQ